MRPSFPSLPPLLRPFFLLQYPVQTPKNVDSFPHSAYYHTGIRDFCLVITVIAGMAVLRDAFRLGVFEPLARRKLMRDFEKRMQPFRGGFKQANGHSPAGQEKINDQASSSSALANGNGNGCSQANGNGHANGYAKHTNGQEGNAEAASLRRRHRRKMNHSVLRFAEQGWSVIYYTVQWSYGLYIHRQLPTRIFNPVGLWEAYPHMYLPGPIKFFYISQIAFYFHQVLILNAEARRKDHLQMMTHHIITIALMILSFFTNFTRVGCLVMVLMDWCDIFLPLAKMIRYIDISQLACDMTFAWFLVSWFITRHFLFVFVIKSLIVDAPKYIPHDALPQDGFHFSKPAYLAFSVLLLALQALQMLWFWMICRVAWRVVNGSGASDTRSDEEGETEGKED